MELYQKHGYYPDPTNQKRKSGESSPLFRLTPALHYKNKTSLMVYASPL